MAVLPLEIVGKISEFCDALTWHSMSRGCRDWNKEVQGQALERWRAHIHKRFPVIRGLFGEEFEKVTEEWIFTKMKDKEMKVQRRWNRKYEWQTTGVRDSADGDQLCAGYEDYFKRLIRREPCGNIGLDFEGPRTIRVTNALGLPVDVSVISLQ
jgi:hypothetical protein